MRPLLRAAATAASLALYAAGAGGAVPTVIYSSISSSPTSDVPGGGGLKFNTIDHPQSSRTGNNWIFLARNPGASTQDAMYIVGSGTAGTMILQEGVTVIESGRVTENTSDRRVGVNDTGLWAAGVNLTGATTDDSVVLTGTGASFSVAFREGQPVPSIANASFGATLAEATVTNTSSIGVRAASLTGSGVTSTTNAALFADSGNTLLARSGTTTPTGQTGAAQTYSTFSSNTFSLSGDGTTWAAKADLNGPTATNQVAVKNNVVLVQEGVTISGMASPVSVIHGNPVIAGNNDVYVRGETASDVPFITRNGTLIAQPGGAVGSGLPGEVWDSTVWNVSNGNTFFLHTGDSLGNYVLGGFTNAPTNQNGVIVYNGNVLLREGDPVDLNGNGLFDDDAFYDITGLTGASLNNKVENAFLSDDGYLYIVGELRNGAGAPLGDAFMRLPVPEPGGVVLLGGAVTLLTRRKRSR